MPGGVGVKKWQVFEEVSSSELVDRSQIYQKKLGVKGKSEQGDRANFSFSFLLLTGQPNNL